MSNDRFRRPDPERTQPIRTWSQTRRAAESWQTASPRPEDRHPQEDPPASWSHPHDPASHASPHFEEEGRPTSQHHASSTESQPGQETAHSMPWQDSVTRGVEMGYRVVEEQIRLGQDMARQLGIGIPPQGPYGEDPWNMLRRALRYSEDMAGLVFQFLGSLAQRPDAMGPFSGSSPYGPAGGRPWPGNTWNQDAPFTGSPWQSPFGAPADNHREAHSGQPHATSPPWPTAHGEPSPTLMVDVHCQRPTRLRFELAPEASSRPLHCQELFCSETDSTLSDVQFAEDGSRCLIIHVSADLPAGQYQGSIIDREHGTPLGCVSLQIAEAHPPAEIYPRAVDTDVGSD